MTPRETRAALNRGEGDDEIYGFSFSKDDVDHPIGVVVRSENEHAQWVQDLMEAMTSDQCRKVARDAYKGGYSILF
jgi:ABC-type metal ion transport system substrate-binding protein